MRFTFGRKGHCLPLKEIIMSIAQANTIKRFIIAYTNERNNSVRMIQISTVVRCKNEWNFIKFYCIGCRPSEPDN